MALSNKITSIIKRNNRGTIMIKRVALFLLTNFLVIVTITLMTSLLGLDKYLTANGIDYKALAILCAIWGTAGAFISLFISKWVAKSSMGVKVIDPQTATGDARRLLDIVYGLTRKTGLTTMPEVGIYDSPELNAFATGPSKNNAIVAVSSGLLQSMDGEQVAAVLGHEISHVKNGDMVTLTLITGVVNAFAMFLSRILAYALSIAMARGENDGSRGGFPVMMYSMFSILFSIVFTLFGTIVVAAFSRWREYRADRGGATLVGKGQMISALQVLKQNTEIVDHRAPSLAALKISAQGGWSSLFASHPPIDKRIERLEELRS
jgi:heat shock protein HtpX